MPWVGLGPLQNQSLGAALPASGLPVSVQPLPAGLHRSLMRWPAGHALVHLEGVLHSAGAAIAGHALQP